MGSKSSFLSWPVVFLGLSKPHGYQYTCVWKMAEVFTDTLWVCHSHNNTVHLREGASSGTTSP